MNENEVFKAEQNIPQAENGTEKNDVQSEFLHALKLANSSYLNIVMTCGCLAICGIIIAIHVRLLYGVAVSFAAALAYMVATKMLLRKALGISYETTSGALTVTKLCAKNKEEIFIPRRLLWVDVTEIRDKAFADDTSKNMRVLHLPATLTLIGENIFEGCDSLETVYFEGTQEEFEKIESSTDFSTFQLIFCDSADYAIKKNKKSKKTQSTEEVAETATEAHDTKENS